MQKNELIRYLKEAVDFETALCQHRAALQLIKNKIEETDIDVEILEPAVYQRREIYTEFRDEVFWRTSPGFWKGMAILLGILSFALVGAPISGQDYMSAIIVTFILLFLGLIMLMFSINLIKYIITKTTDSNQNRKNLKQYEASVQKAREEYQAALQKHQEQSRERDKIQAQLLLAEEQLEQNIAQLQFYLDIHYRKGVLYPKYQNIIATAQLLEYIESGVAEKLEGSDGAYAQYLLDERTNRICTRLDEIICCLQSIARTQFELYKRIEQIQTSLERLDSKLGTIDNNILRLSGTALNVQQYTKEALPLLQQTIKSVDTIAVNSYINTLNQYRQSTIDRYLLEYPQKG